MNLNERHLHLLGLAMIFFVAASVGFSIFFRLITREAAKKVDDPVMEMEFVKTTADIEAITEKRVEAHNALKTFLILDSFAFVPLYFGFLLLMSFYLSHASFEWAKIAAVIVVAVAITAAAADWTENFYSYSALDKVLTGSQTSVSQIFWAAHVKWISIFIAIGIVSTFFLRGGWWNYPARAILIFSVTAMIGLFFYRPLITLSLIVQFLIILILGILFLFPHFRLCFLHND